MRDMIDKILETSSKKNLRNLTEVLPIYLIHFVRVNQISLTF